MIHPKILADLPTLSNFLRVPDARGKLEIHLARVVRPQLEFFPHRLLFVSLIAIIELYQIKSIKGWNTLFDSISITHINKI